MKRSITFLCFALTTSNIAAHASSNSGYDFFVGSQVGLQNSMHRINNEDKTVAGIEQKDTHSHKLSGIIGILAGIQFKTSSSWVLGTDVELSFAPNKTEEHTISTPLAGSRNTFRPFKTSYERDFAIGLGLKAGYSINKIVPYIRLGVEYSRFTHTFEGQVNLPVSDRVTASRKYGAWGFVPGIGIDIPLAGYEHVFINMEARYAFYPSKTINGASISGLTGSSTVKPRFINLNLGFKVMF